MLEYPRGQDTQTLLLMYLPASQAEQNVAPCVDVSSSPQATHDSLPASAWYSFAAQSLQSEESDLPTSEEYLPGGHALQSDALTTPVAEEYVPLGQFSHALSTLSRSVAAALVFPCFPAGHSAHSVASFSLVVLYP